jgi:hypothetical protein
MDENILAIDHGARLGLSRMIAGQIADDQIGINGEHAGVWPRRRFPQPFP